MTDKQSVREMLEQQRQERFGILIEHIEYVAGKWGKWGATGDVFFALELIQKKILLLLAENMHLDDGLSFERDTGEAFERAFARMDELSDLIDELKKEIAEMERQIK